MRVPREMRRMGHVPVNAVMAIMMRLGWRAGEKKDRTGDQGRRRQTNEPADSGATATQRRHERALFNFTQRLRPSRSPLRNSHGRERYVGAVTRRLTGRGGERRRRRQALEIAARGQAG